MFTTGASTHSTINDRAIKWITRQAILTPYWSRTYKAGNTDLVLVQDLQGRQYWPRIGPGLTRPAILTSYWSRTYKAGNTDLVLVQDLQGRQYWPRIVPGLTRQAILTSYWSRTYKAGNTDLVLVQDLQGRQYWPRIVPGLTRQAILTSYCSLTFSWAKNHFGDDSPFPSDLRAELRMNDDLKLDRSGLELQLLKPASRGCGDGESDLVGFSSSPFINGSISSFFTWTFTARSHYQYCTVQPGWPRSRQCEIPRHFRDFCGTLPHIMHTVLLLRYQALV